MFISYRDNVVWDEEQEKSAQLIAEKQLKARLPQEKLGKYKINNLLVYPWIQLLMFHLFVHCGKNSDIFFEQFRIIAK